jgi:hypothetical protein
LQLQPTPACQRRPRLNARRTEIDYRNVEIRDAAGQRSHVEREIIQTEADIIRQIFRLSAEGHGVKAIAKQLNAERAPSPRAQQGRSQSWAPSSVREVLFRPAYRGEVLYAQTAKRDGWGEKKRAARPEAEWIRREAPALRIVTDDEWNAAHSRLSTARNLYLKATNGRPFGRPALGNPSKYLLTNLAQCFHCGGPLQACSRSHGRERKRFYGCSAYHDRGRTICPNGHDVPMQDANDILIEALMDDVLDPSMVADAVASAIEMLRSEDGGTARATAIDDELERLSQERSRLVSAVTNGQLQGGIFDVLRALETRTARLERERQTL